MALLKEFKNDFSFGEISSKLKGRYDLEIYKRGLDKMKNCFVNTQTSLINKTLTVNKDFKLDLGLGTDEELIKVYFYLKNRLYKYSNDIVVIYQVHNTSTNKYYLRSRLYKLSDPNTLEPIQNTTPDFHKEVDGEIRSFISTEDDNLFISFKEKVKNGGTDEYYVFYVEMKYDNADRKYFIDGELHDLSKKLITHEMNRGPTKNTNLFYDERLKWKDTNLTQAQSDLLASMKNIIFRQDPKTKLIEISFYEEKPKLNDFRTVKYKGTVKEINGNERPMTLEEAKFMFPDVYSPDYTYNSTSLDEIVFPVMETEVLKSHTAVKRISNDNLYRLAEPIKHNAGNKHPTTVQTTTNELQGLESEKPADIKWLQKGTDSSKQPIYLTNSETKVTTSTTESSSFEPTEDKFITYVLVPITIYNKPDLTQSIYQSKYGIYHFVNATIATATASTENSSKAGKFFTPETVDYKYSSEYKDGQHVSGKLLLYNEANVGGTHKADYQIHGESPTLIEHKYDFSGTDRQKVTPINIAPIADFIKDKMNEIFILGGIGRLDEDELKEDVKDGKVYTLTYKLTKMPSEHTEITNPTTGDINVIWLNTNSNLVWFKEYINLHEIKDVNLSDQRFILQGTKDESTEMISSSYNDLYNFTYITNDEYDPFHMKVNSNRDTDILQLIKVKDLYIVTNNGIYGALSIQNKGNVLKSNFELITTVKPAPDVEPILINDVLIFVSKNKRKIFLITVNEDGNRFKVEEVTSSNDEMFDQINSLEQIDFNYDSGYSTYVVSGLSHKYINGTKTVVQKTALIRTDVVNKINSFCEVELGEYEADGSFNHIDKLTTFKDISYGYRINEGILYQIKDGIPKSAIFKLLPPSNSSPGNRLPAFMNSHYTINSVELYCSGNYRFKIGTHDKRFDVLNNDLITRKEYQEGEVSVVQFPIEYSKFRDTVEIEIISGDLDEHGKEIEREIIIFGVILYYDTK